ncbi:MAG TPA: tetratricopeptide repeat protein [Myxococcales bacterium]|jgi:tetratricopeptide (TPR) repeat protein
MNAKELEQRAERAVRRGELLVALEHFDAYLAQEPDDERVRTRMESVRALLQPSELVSRRRSEPEEPETTSNQLSDAELGELHASSGRFDEAAESYARAVETNPKNELLRERLEELRALAQPRGRANLAAAERLDALTPARGVAKVARSAKASEASFAPLPRGNALPKDPVALLKELLERVRSARRPI